MNVFMWNIKSFVIGCIVGVFITDAIASDHNAGEFSAKLSPGVPAKMGEFPFIGSLQRYDWHFCSFSLVSTKVGVTSGNCLEGMSMEGVRGYLGDIQRGRGVEVEFSRTYPIERSDRNNHNVITVLIFTRPVSFTDNIQPILLPSTNMSFVGENATFASWGSGTGEFLPADTLQKIQFKIVNKLNHMACLPENRDAVEIAEPYSEGFLTYFEDAGGPLFINEYEKDYLVGVFSYKLRACPSVVFFTSILNYRNPILEAIASANEDSP